MRTHFCASSTLTSRSMARCRKSMVRISSNMSMMLLDAGLSVPMPTRTPSCRRSASGATPQPSLALLLGQWATATSVLLQDADVVAGDVHAVDGEEVAVEHVPLLQVLDGRDPVGLDQHALPAHLLAVVVGELARARADVGELVLALGDVAHDLEAALARQPADRLVEAAGHGVRRVRREADLDARGGAGLSVVEPPHHVGQRLVEARVVDAEDLKVDAAAQAGGCRPPPASPRRSWCRRWW